MQDINRLIRTHTSLYIHTQSHEHLIRGLNFVNISSNITFSVAPKVMPFSFGDEPFHAGQSATLQCTFTDGDLPIKIDWSFDGEPLSPLMEVSAAQLTRRVSVLTIESVDEKHVGNYSCQGSNSAGIVSYSTRLIVNGVVIVCNSFPLK